MEMRQVAATRSNQYSSRSHTIFILKVTQKFPNESEKLGVLNLVDLAGSEKVGKTGATGELLEEAKKINSSLSAIGNVIHALVFKTSHIPYRDSKLTRILQESLGGNYKTTLVVTCSNHSTHLEETISTLRFAQRTRAIKNQVKINIKHSPQQLQTMIEQLKFELDKALAQIKLLKKDQVGEPYLTKKYMYIPSPQIQVIKEEPESPRQDILNENIKRPMCIKKRDKRDRDINSFVSQEESKTGDELTEYGLLHNSPKEMSIKSNSNYIYIYIYSILYN